VEQATSALQSKGYTAREVQGFFAGLLGQRSTPRRRGGGGLVLAAMILVGGGLAAIPIAGIVAERGKLNDDDRVLIQQLRPEELAAFRELTEAEALVDQRRGELERISRE